MRARHSKSRLAPATLVVALPFVLAAALFAGCAESPQTGGLSGRGGDGDGDPDAGADGGGGDATDEPSVLPEGDVVLVYVDPGRAVYEPEDLVTPRAELVLAGTSDPVEGAAFDFTAAPTSAVREADDGAYEIIGEGPITFVACLRAERAEGEPEPPCGSLTVVSDAGPPTLVIEAPRPGEMLRTAPIEVRGRVTDSGHAPRVFLAGEELEVGADGRFVGSLPARFGVNHVDVTATDGIHPDETRGRLDVLWAPAYRAPASRTSTTYEFDPAIVMRLGRDFFDDGVPYVPDPEALEVTTDDLVGLLELTLREADLLPLVPDPLIDDERLHLRIADISVGEPRVDIVITERGLEAFVQLRDVTLNTEGDAQFTPSTPLDLDGVIVLTASAFARLRFEKRVGEPLRGELEDFGLVIDEALGDFASEEADAIFLVAESALRTMIDDAVIGALVEGFVDDILQTVGDLLVSIDETLDFGTVSLAVDPLPPVQLVFQGRVAAIEPTFHEAFDVRIQAGIGSASPPLYPDAPGIPLTAAAIGEPELRTTARLEIALDLALLNGLLYTLWNSGLLEVDVTDALPELSALMDRITVSAKLPPLIGLDLNGQLELRLGQFELSIWKNDTFESHALSIRAGASIVIGPEGIEVVLAAPEIDAWLIGREGGRPVFRDSADLAGLITSVVWPSLLDTLGENLALPLPELDLSELGAIAPRLRDFSARVVLEDHFELRGNHLFLDAILQGHAVFP
jgi:hypothetical protein